MKDEELVAKAIAQWNNRASAQRSREEEEEEEQDSGDERKPPPVVVSSEPTTGATGNSLIASSPTPTITDRAGAATIGKKPRKKYKARVKDPIHHYPVPPRLINMVQKPKSYVNHSYRDFSCVPPEERFVAPISIADMTFAQKVHHMLSQPQFEAMIAWRPHGRAFQVLRPNDFEQQVMPMYFGHSRYSNFLSMIRQYGLKYFTQGPDKSCLYHEFMLRGLPHLAKYMPLPRTPRRLIEDPENEPDLYTVSKLYPVTPRAQEPLVAASSMAAAAESASGSLLSPRDVALLAAASAAQQQERLAAAAASASSSLSHPQEALALATSHLHAVHPALAEVASLPPAEVRRTDSATIAALRVAAARTVDPTNSLALSSGGVNPLSAALPSGVNDRAILAAANQSITSDHAIRRRLLLAAASQPVANATAASTASLTSAPLLSSLALQQQLSLDASSLGRLLAHTHRPLGFLDPSSLAASLSPESKNNDNSPRRSGFLNASSLAALSSDERKADTNIPSRNDRDNNL